MKMTERSTPFYVSERVVRLKTVDEEGQVRPATGFLMQARDFLSLYTCWHVVAGFDPLDPPARYPPRRIILIVETMRREQRQPGVEVVGGSAEVCQIPLFDERGNPVWLQPASREAAFDGAIGYPFMDAVRINMNKYSDEELKAFPPCDDIMNDIEVGDDAFIVGFPYGYSPWPNTPGAVFVRRTKAAFGPFLPAVLDGPGAKGMSGSPLVTKRDGEWRLCGMYTGVAFPDRPLKQESGFPLGKYLPLVVVRASLGAQPHQQA